MTFSSTVYTTAYFPSSALTRNSACNGQGRDDVFESHFVKDVCVMINCEEDGIVSGWMMIWIDVLVSMKHANGVTRMAAADACMFRQAHEQ
jgi:hypothetical protein